MAFNPTYKTVENEGCELHYWYQGTGPLIIFIPGGNGHGKQYNKMMTILSPNYTCATFDRRKMSASTCKVNKLLSPPQQARDVATIIKAMSFEKSIVFGSSLGGVIAFQFGIDFPKMVEHLICHEAPTSSLLPDSTKIHDILFPCYELYRSSGLDAAVPPFKATFVGYTDEGVPPTVSPEPHNPINFWENEFLPATFYTPDLRKLGPDGHDLSVAVIAGARSRDAWYARTTIEQQKIIGCLRIVAPGHHQGFEVEVEEFTPVFVKLLKDLDDRRAHRDKA
jgi:pimeloyl-ACP methyl ester carboxylesterase